MSQSAGTILVVDDQLGVRRLMQEAFQGEGYTVHTAANGREALAKLDESQPGLILLDMKMPGMNGLETLREIKKRNPEQVVIMMTAYEELEVVAEAIKLGVKEYVTKPCDINELKVLVAEALCG
jgi:two-component system response regulator (stage 0 sporulation protein F)